MLLLGRIYFGESDEGASILPVSVNNSHVWFEKVKKHNATGLAL